MMVILLSSSSQMYHLKYTSAEHSVEINYGMKYDGILIFLKQTTLMHTVKY